MKKYISTLSIWICLSFATAHAQHADPVTEKVVIDNAKMKVTEYNSNPGEGVCGKGKHSHPAHLTVLLTPADVTITLPDGKTVVQHVPAGATFWSEAETHTISNTGKAPVKAYLIETKN